MSTNKDDGNNLPQVLEHILSKQNLSPTVLAAKNLRYELLFKLTLRNANLPYGLRLRCLLYHFLLQNELKKKTQNFSRNEWITHVKNLENIEFAAVNGTLLNAIEREYYFSVLENLEIPKLHGKLLLWFGTIQPKKQRIVFGFFDTISLLLLALPFLASITSLTAYLLCPSIEVESKFTYSILFTLLSILTFANLKNRGYESYKIGAKYFQNKKNTR